MNDLIEELFRGLLHLVGISVDDSSQRKQAQAMFTFCAVFGLIAGCVSTGLASMLWFIVCGVCLVALIVVTYWTCE